MKKITLIYIACICTVLFSCKKFADFQTDPNRINDAPPELLMNTVSQQLFSSSINPEIGLITRQLVYTDGASEYQYYNWNRRSWKATFDKLRQVQRLEIEAYRTQQEQYLPVVLFAKSYYFYELTMLYGDIPFTEALGADDKNFTPTYTPQKEVFIQILKDLETANSLINHETKPIQGDWIYQGNMLQWKKLINSFTLRILLSLSNQINDTELSVVEKFSNIINQPQNYPIINSNNDNAGLNYLDMPNNRYPYFNSNSLQTAYYMEGTFVNLLKNTSDKRLFRFAAPLNNQPENVFSSYDATAGSEAFDMVNSQAKQGKVSGIHPRFHNNPTNEMAMGISYTEVQLILAEAISKGWITGNASEKYINAVKASFSSYELPESDAAQYLQHHPFDTTKALEQIITQKYINCFINNGWLAFFEHRRTNFPTFDTSGAGVQNQKLVPSRFMYDTNELQFNQPHVQNAIQSQFGGNESINGILWIMK